MRLALASQGFTTDEIAKKQEELVGQSKIDADTINSLIMVTIDIVVYLNITSQMDYEYSKNNM